MLHCFYLYLYVKESVPCILFSHFEHFCKANVLKIGAILSHLCIQMTSKKLRYQDWLNPVWTQKYTYVLFKSREVGRRVDWKIFELSFLIGWLLGGIKKKDVPFSPQNDHANRAQRKVRRAEQQNTASPPSSMSMSSSLLPSLAIAIL